MKNTTKLRLLVYPLILGDLALVGWLVTVLAAEFLFILAVSIFLGILIFTLGESIVKALTED